MRAKFITEFADPGYQKYLADIFFHILCEKVFDQSIEDLNIQNWISNPNALDDAFMFLARLASHRGKTREFDDFFDAHVDMLYCPDTGAIMNPDDPGHSPDTLDALEPYSSDDVK
ncbi:MAG: hypothetical protein ACD_51C00007G0001 [uncultured bacterium]|nr:MAG: hypothetical protein ACD_51C00007G0001 [uncultured bacterium]